MKKKTKYLETCSNADVHDDLWREILSWLPVKTVLRFRCVRRSWLALISDPDFVRLHLTRFNNKLNESHLFVVQGSLGKAKCFVKSSRTLRTTTKLEVLQSDTQSSNILRSTLAHGSSVRIWSVVCSTDGLLMLRNNNLIFELMAWNPSIKKTRKLPLPPHLPHGSWFGFGLGFDSLLKDYKHVIFAESRGVHFVEIYNFGTNLWKRIELQGQGSSNWSQDFSCNRGQTTICFRGILYALARNRYDAPSQLISFDLSREVFASNRLPVDDNHRPNVSKVLAMADGENSIAFVHLSRNRGSVWVLDSLGADMNSCSWTKRYTFSPKILGNPNCLRGEFFYLKKNGEMFLNKDRKGRHGHGVTSYNLETREIKVVLKRNLPWGNAVLYKESLLLMD